MSLHKVEVPQDARNRVEVLTEAIRLGEQLRSQLGPTSGTTPQALQSQIDILQTLLKQAVAWTPRPEV